MAEKESVIQTFSGKEVKITSPSKIYFSKRSETKIDLVDYYEAISEQIMNTMGGRPVLLQRFPNGASGKSFFQKRVPKSAPDWLETTTVSTPNGTESNAMVVKDLAHIIWAVNMGSLGFHVWPYKAATPEISDELRIDLDPTPGTTFEDARLAAGLVKDFIDELGMKGFAKTSGSKGIHIFLRLKPIWDSFQVRAAAVAMARELERRHPNELTAAWWKEERGSKIFIDFNQNCPHKTMFGAWCVRPRVGAQVSTPFYWEELNTIDPEILTIETVPARVQSDGDPWADINQTKCDIDELLKMSKTDMTNGLMDAPWPPQYPKQPNEPPRVQPSRAKKYS